VNIEEIKKKLKEFEGEYINFVGIREFPNYELTTKDVSLEVAERQGFDSVATTLYFPKEGVHKLIVSNNLLLSEEYIFHEFTHMLDSEIYVRNDKTRYAALSGFTEYHASQIELMRLLGASKLTEEISFSMKKEIITFSGEKSVEKYVKMKQQHAIELFSRNDFPANIETLKSAVGILFNYFGLRSICEMYSIDYKEEIMNESFLKFIPTQKFVILNNLMHGWLDDSRIELSMQVYVGIVFPLIREYGLV
jgi:hypothetical protein